MKYIKFFFLFALFVGTATFSGCSPYKNAESLQTLSTSFLNVEQVPKEESQINIYVFVTGAVAHPGVYIVPENSRVYEAVNLAGGFTEEADKEAVNQVDIIQDGDEIYIPAISSDDDKSTISADKNNDGKVNINTADAAALTSLRGIGEGKAKAIIDYRLENGKFNSVEDIMLVPGIKEGTFNAIKDDIKVR